MSDFTEAQFIELVKQSEAEAARDFGAYKTKVALFALLGYIVIFTVLVSLVLLVGGTLGIALLSGSLFLLLIKKKIIIAILAAIWTFLKALWIKFDPPTGYELKRDQFPELFDEIDSLTRSLKSLKIHQVFIENDLNAAVVQHPRFGVLGGQRNVLFLGLQMLLALSPEEMRAVLAHEFGHLSGNHSRFRGWIYRVRTSWLRVMTAFRHSNSFGARMMRRFFNWYAPTFEAYSFALARADEYEADRMAAQLTSPETAAKALINSHTKAPYIEQEFWDAYIRKADDMPEPPTLPFEGLAEFLKHSPMTREKLLELIQRGMQEETHYADTHPSLKERVNSLIDLPVIPDVFDTNAAEAWLGEKYQDVLTHFDKQWLDHNAERWKGRFTHVQNAKAILQEAESLDLDVVTDDKLWALAKAAHEFKGNDAALPLFERFQQRKPDSVGAAYFIGAILAARGDEQALRHLRIAFKSPETLDDAARWGYHLLKSRGKEQEAEYWWQEAIRANEQLPS